MKQRTIAVIAMLAFLLAVTVGAVRVCAQEPTPTPGAPTPAPASDIDSRIDKLEAGLESLNEQYRSIIASAGTLITIMIAVQGSVAGAQLFLEARRDRRQARREEGWDDVDRAGVKQVASVMDVVQKTLENRLEIEQTGIGQVSKIMDVLQKTLESHLKTEERASEMVEKVEEQLADALHDLRPLRIFYPRLQETIKQLRKDIEERAFQLAQASRHDFRRKADDLGSFARQFDEFEKEFRLLEEGEMQFTARVPYIRGVAAHYANQPETANQHFEEIDRFQEPEPDEDRHACNRRIANSYYYLGLTQSNFGNYEAAIDFFEKANRLDPEVKDFLTRIVTAEAYLMIRDYDKALQSIDQVKTGVLATERNERGRLRDFYLRLWSRAILIEANVAILRRGADWYKRVQGLLEPVHKADSQYYYATATLAQVCYDQGDHSRAQELFREAYATIEQLGHRFTVTEARSKILLLMVEGLCCKHGSEDEDENQPEMYLRQASDLLGSLPRMGSQVCTVFSTLSKRNESSDTIRHHIGLLRRGKVLL